MRYHFAGVKASGMVYASVSHSQFNTIWKQNKTIIPAVVLQVIENN